MYSDRYTVLGSEYITFHKILIFLITDYDAYAIV